MVLVGYDEYSRTYKLYDPTNDRIYSRRYADVIFDENPKMQCSTPTFKTATPLDVQLFHTESDDELSKDVCDDITTEQTSKAAGLSPQAELDPASPATSHRPKSPQSAP